MQIISRQEAQEQGLKKYYTGKPCKHGHLVEYWVSYGCCVMCDAIKRNVNKARKRVESVSKLPSWYDKEVHLIKDIYKECAEMSDGIDGEIYHVDHDVPLKHKLVCGLHTIRNLQILTKLENGIKKNKFEVV